MASAQLPHLFHPANRQMRERLRHRLTTMAVDHQHPGTGKLPSGIHHVRQHRCLTHGMQYLGYIGIHAAAFAGRQNDNT